MKIVLKAARHYHWIAFISLNVIPFGTANALEFSWGYRLPFETEYNSNIQMVENNRESVMLYRLIPTLSFVARDQLNTYRATGGLLIQRSSNERISEDRNDPNAGLTWQREIANGNFTLGADYRKASIRTTELTRSGQVFNDGTSMANAYTANLTYNLTDKLVTTNDVGYQRQRYSDATLVDFTNKYFRTRLSYLYTEKLSPFLGFSINKYDESNNNTNLTNNLVGGDSVSREYIAGFNYQVTERLSTNAFAGVNSINSEGSEWIGAAGLDWGIDDNSTLTARISRAVNASGLGGFQKADSLTSSYTYQLTQLDSVGANFTWTKNRSINDFESKELAGFYNRNLTENWIFRAYANYRNLQSVGFDANGYTIGISFAYSKPNF